MGEFWTAAASGARRRFGKNATTSMSSPKKSAVATVLCQRSPKKTSIQCHAATDKCGDVQIFALVNRRLAFIEAAFGNDRQRQLFLTHP